MKNILWFTEWFPTSFDPYVGDGIERRAKAASLYNNIYVIYVKKKQGLSFGKIEIEERQYNNNYKAFIYYYPSIRHFSVLLDFLLSNYYFIRLHYKAIINFKKKYGKPHCIQVNVAMKNGIIAILCKWLWRTKYLIVEGWSLFLPESKPGFNDKDFIFRFLARYVIRHSSILVTVSKHLGEMIKANIADVPYKVVPSVVDKTIFFPAAEAPQNKAPRFIHISNLDYAKNISQILSALKLVIAKGHAAELVMHVPYNEKLMSEIASMGLMQYITIVGEADQNVLADSIRPSDVLILFSRYETFGNVVIEAQACGVPVITSNYPTFFETVEDNKNGIIANGMDAGTLAGAMINFINKKINFDRKSISEKAIASYSFERIGKMLDDIYNEYF